MPEDSALAWGIALWSLVAVTAVHAGKQFWLYRQAQRVGERSLRRDIQEQGKKYLNDRPNLKELESAWEAVLQGQPTPEVAPCGAPALFAIHFAPEPSVTAMRKVFEQSINQINNFAELIDIGVLRPTDFVRRYPELHVALLQELALLEPFVWYEYLLASRGRWGFRPLQLREVLNQLRCLSDDDSVLGDITICLFDDRFRVGPAIGRIDRIRGRISSALRPPTINTATKLTQRRRGTDLARDLRAMDLEVMDSAWIRGAVNW